MAGTLSDGVPGGAGSVARETEPEVPGRKGGGWRGPYPFSSAGRIRAVTRAGRAASATLVRHRDAWEFVAAQVGSHPHFRTSALEEREDGLVAAVLSGRSLVVVLLSLYRVTETGLRGEDAYEPEIYADRAMASQVYGAVAGVRIRTLPVEGEPIVVTTDSRMPHHDEFALFHEDGWVGGLGRPDGSACLGVVMR
ncbi:MULTISPECIES: hypothetical protein [unclassified Streptomyces]|uniref:hypothetical protein n=1 Tax=unclassified Streptomyces TaxID=2593676 RepID=UPI0033170D2A